MINWIHIDLKILFSDSQGETSTQQASTSFREKITVHDIADQPLQFIYSRKLFSLPKENEKSSQKSEVDEMIVAPPFVPVMDMLPFLAEQDLHVEKQSK